MLDGDLRQLDRLIEPAKVSSHNGSFSRSRGLPRHDFENLCEQAQPHFALSEALIDLPEKKDR